LERPELFLDAGGSSPIRYRRAFNPVDLDWKKEYLFCGDEGGGETWAILIDAGSTQQNLTASIRRPI
jgi:hypothetical protein